MRQFAHLGPPTAKFAKEMSGSAMHSTNVLHAAIYIQSVWWARQGVMAVRHENDNHGSISKEDWVMYFTKNC